MTSRYVDLGLPSGTRWFSVNETQLYDYDSAVREFSESLPTKKQWEELKDYCHWSWKGNKYKVTGPNGNSIVLTETGGRNCDGDVYPGGGYYWSSTPYDSEAAWTFCFYSWKIYMDTYANCYGRAVRRVQNY